ncbi:LPXTG cell wall anchor domain-containing protein [Streptomyces gilvus]|uniref:LPXTG cell wall anchor domain-containing protein n=1 Tax=Streptomyces gilvus TaxID=2920937 RepID=UPI001F0F36D3|nr:LPXTG cell wall anchor domain-containing protein [Streptomyces sp. CME 23]MCH5673894.1 LPXTG cell wall anchor domain-containing protein [Streptomyces sp. CME 23]
MRTLTRAGALSAVAAAALFAAPVAAHAAPVAAGPGDNGTVKIHDARTGEELRRNEPQVCTFYLDAFGFDGLQKVDWHIEAWAPTAASKGATVKTGAITLDARGHGRTEDLSLPDGHYKLFWNFDGEKGAAKHKVFWTDCAGQGTGGSTSAPAPSSSASASASPSAGASAAPSASSSEAGSVSASSSPSAQGGSDSGGLAETGNGVPVGLLSGAAAALVAGGGYLVVRRRRA